MALNEQDENDIRVALDYLTGWFGRVDQFTLQGRVDNAIEILNKILLRNKLGV